MHADCTVCLSAELSTGAHPANLCLSLVHSREAAEKQQREAEKQQREVEKQQREAAERLRQEEERKKQQQAVSQHFAESMRLMQQKVGGVQRRVCGLRSAGRLSQAAYGARRAGGTATFAAACGQPC